MIRWISPQNLARLDAAFPTIVRYAGVMLAILIVLGGIFGRGGSSVASGGVLALGMILYKSVKDAASNGDAPKSEPRNGE